jgi:hypothetical protein
MRPAPKSEVSQSVNAYIRYELVEFIYPENQGLVAQAVIEDKATAIMPMASCRIALKALPTL